MDELINILDSKGNDTGRTALKSEAHKMGWYHATVHIWFFTADGSVLVQQRAATKDTYPLLWDVSVAGHIGAGESIEAAALREVKEEIGLNIAINNLEKITVVNATHIHSKHLIDREFHHVFLSRLKEPVENLVMQKGEVANLQLVSLLQFSQETCGLTKASNYVPHGSEYYSTIVNAINARLNSNYVEGY